MSYSNGLFEFNSGKTNEKLGTYNRYILVFFSITNMLHFQHTNNQSKCVVDCSASSYVIIQSLPPVLHGRSMRHKAEKDNTVRGEAESYIGIEAEC